MMEARSKTVAKWTSILLLSACGPGTPPSPDGIRGSESGDVVIEYDSGSLVVYHDRKRLVTCWARVRGYGTAISCLPDREIKGGS